MARKVKVRVQPYTFYTENGDCYVVYGTPLQAHQYAAWQTGAGPRPPVAVLIYLNKVARPVLTYPSALDTDGIFSREEDMFGALTALYNLERKLAKLEGRIL